ncbi:hypothetical protein GYA28_03750 [Candidatus Roizmanbacteria bacterium]|nr:hypothetical protein [Candidatus Roizmanbacteria bacterium]
MFKRLIIIILTVVYFMFGAGKVRAGYMESSGFRIQGGNVNMGSDNMSTPGATLSTTLGQLAAGKFDSDGYIVKAGFQYIHSIVPFTFSISDSRIDFGSILNNEPKTATTNLRVSFGGAGNYQVTAAELGRLGTLSGDYIDNTSCDNSDCDVSTASVWDLDTTYGFGYNIDGEDIPATYTSCYLTNSKLCYRPFPDTTLPTPTPAAVIMSSDHVTVDLTSKPKDIIHESTVTFKLNVSSAQPAGSYQTVISFIATPSY